MPMRYMPAPTAMGTPSVRKAQLMLRTVAGWAGLLAKYDAVQQVWISALSKASRMELDGACGEIRSMLSKAKRFRAAVLSVLDDLTNIRCAHPAEDVVVETVRPPPPAALARQLNYRDSRTTGACRAQQLRDCSDSCVTQKARGKASADSAGSSWPSPVALLELVAVPVLAFGLAWLWDVARKTVAGASAKPKFN